MSDAFDPPVGAPQVMAPLLRRVLAPNPSPMTYRGTNTYLLGDRQIAVIDPGPNDAAHLQAILAALEPEQEISHIFVTHSHKDHSPLAAPMSKATGAPVLAFGGADAGRSYVMKRLAANAMLGGGEGVDKQFSPDMQVSEGDRFETEDWSLEVLHTPGHIGNHICLAWKDSCFVGDHVMGWASSLVSPPDGDLTDFMASCARLSARQWETFFPGHGEVIRAPNDRLSWLISHRLAREAAILDALTGAEMTVRALTAIVYQDTPAHLLPAAQRNVIAHLVDLMGKSMVLSSAGLHENALFSASLERLQ